jgi:predicted TIM-barrel fold metal-dependent hydrolase
MLNADDTETGRSPLELAISIARADLVEVLLQHGADVNRATMQTWRAPIHYALRYYETDQYKYGPVLQVLQTWGANFMAADCNNYPAFEYARKLGVMVQAGGMPLGMTQGAPPMMQPMQPMQSMPHPMQPMQPLMQPRSMMVMQPTHNSVGIPYR